MPLGDFANADLVMGVVIAASAVFGLMRGFLREVLSLVIWAGALLFGIAFADRVAGLMGLDLSPGLQTAIGFAAVFVAILIAGAILQRLVGGLVKSTGLTGTDRTLGLVFGTLRGATVVLVALIVLRPFAESREWWQVSRIAPALLTFEAEVLEAFDYIVNGIAGGREPGAPTEPVVGDELRALTEPVVAMEPDAPIEPAGDEPRASTEPAADEPEAQ